MQIALLLTLTLVAAARAAPAPPADAWRTTAPLAVVDLASDTAWMLSVDDGPARHIRVPGGGFNSDRQGKPWVDPASVKDHVLYERRITIPKVQAGQVTLVEFGAVNHGAEVFLVEGGKEKLVAAHHGPLMPFAADLTHAAVPGKSYTLRVKAYPMWHYGRRVPVGFIYEEAWKPNNGWASKFGYGITKYVRLAVYPEVSISDVFVRTSVCAASLSAQVRLRNHSPAPRAVSLSGRLSSWNGDAWKYPPLPERKVTLPPDSETTVTLGPVAWTLGPASYWWPNRPFREEYRAKLHLLDLAVRENGALLHRRTQRFGFVEWSEGPFYYLVNGVRINCISDGTPESAMSEYDCYSTSPAFLPPTGPGTGCPETWRRYLRMGISANRIHQSTPTQYMMDTADELGFMLIPETAIRGCQGQVWDDNYLPQAAKELALACRSHPSVCRYSLQNEAPPAWAGPLADALAAVDDTRPMVFEDNQQNHAGRITGKGGAHAYCMLHYQDHPRPAMMITGVGECSWPIRDGLEDFARRALDGRRNDICYYAGWDWINYWPNFLQGMSAEKHAWHQSPCFRPDRADGVDGWGSPVIRWAQRCFSPYLVLDTAFYEANPGFGKEWPKSVPAFAPGDPIERALEVFNDGLSGDRLSVRWAAHWDSPAGPVAAKGEMAGIPVKPGFHVSRTLSFPAPAAEKRRELFLVLESVKDGKVVFSDDQVRFTVDPRPPAPTAKFAGEDAATRGDWPGKFGKDGYEVAGGDSKLPAGVRLTWQGADLWTYHASTDDPRAPRASRSGSRRVAAARYSDRFSLLVDAGSEPRRLSLLFIDWDNKGRILEVALSREGGRVLDHRMVSGFRDGKYLTWIVSGRLRVDVARTAGDNALVNGVFFDPV